MEPDPQKDLEHEYPIPGDWRSVFVGIAHALCAGDLELATADPTVRRLSPDEGARVRDSIEGYGDVTLAELSDATWARSVASWQGTHWETIVDLCTVEEGSSDLGLHTTVRETDDGFTFDVRGVWVE